jgi:hypothetical protein
MRYSGLALRGLRRFCAELGAIDAYEEDPVGNLRASIAGSFGETWDLAFHATTTCFGRA